MVERLGELAAQDSYSLDDLLRPPISPAAPPQWLRNAAEYGVKAADYYAGMPMRALRGVPLQTPGVLTEEDAFRQNVLEDAKRNWGIQTGFGVVFDPATAMATKVGVPGLAVGASAGSKIVQPGKVPPRPGNQNLTHAEETAAAREQFIREYDALAAQRAARLEAEDAAALRDRLRVVSDQAGGVPAEAGVKLKLGYRARSPSGDDHVLILNNSGDEIGHIKVRNLDPENPTVTNIYTAIGPNSLGPTGVRDIHRQLSQMYPEAKRFAGGRNSGARPGRPVYVLPSERLGGIAAQDIYD